MNIASLGFDDYYRQHLPLARSPEWTPARVTAVDRDSYLIRNDSDAIDCMKASLIKLAEKADCLALQAISEFSRHIQYVIANAENPLQLHDQALSALEDCLRLLAWQLELIDAKTGLLALDEAEQTSLIATVTLQIPQKDFRYKPQQRLHPSS